MNDLFEKATKWVENDHDPNTKQELTELIIRAKEDQNTLIDLQNRFSGFLKFGTAGLRGEVGAGESCMNLALVRQATAGLAQHLLAKTSGKVPVLIVGHDARFMSKEFANEVAKVATHFKIEVKQLPGNVPTPLLAFSVKMLKADCGVMITASHNPPQDNGYKVYDELGAGIIPPVDEEISKQISKQELPLAIAEELTWQQIDTKQDYLKRLKSIVPKIEHRDLKIAYTPLHGVGKELFMQAVDNLDLTNVFVVAEQAQPDPTFKTVKFPNPEEPGATDLLIDLAQKVDADLAIANDPDADRCAIGVQEAGNWRMLKGDELGILFAWWIMQKPNLDKQSVFSSSIVSSSLVPKMAKENGFLGQTTLTGMKWAGHIANLRFGYEEAIGYSVDPAAVSDKDGISAALLAIEIMDWAKGENKSLTEVLAEIYQTYGLHLTDQISIRLSDVEIAKQKVAELIKNPPKTLANELISSVIDMKQGFNGLPSSVGVVFELTSARVIVRPSGTEPKIKCYLEVNGEYGTKSTQEKRLKELSNAMTQLLS
jgi:phosphomannomutase